MTDRRNMVRLFAGYQIPKIEVSVNAYWRYESGWPYAPYVRVPAGLTGWSSRISINAMPRGWNGFMIPAYTQTDLRLEKVFNYGVNRFGLYLDLQNAFNQNSRPGSGHAVSIHVDNRTPRRGSQQRYTSAAERRS